MNLVGEFSWVAIFDDILSRFGEAFEGDADAGDAELIVLTEGNVRGAPGVGNGRRVTTDLV